jgi:hypothetical protein
MEVGSKQSASMLTQLNTTLKMEAICFFKTLVEFQQAMQRHVPGDGSLHNHHYENLRSYKEYVAPLLNIGGTR